MKKVYLILGFCLVLFAGCLAKPLSEGANVTVKTGCDFSNPPCQSNETCMNNTCVLKSGCDYSNPPCDTGLNQSCVNNTCVSPTVPQGCAHSNPPCGEDYQCVANECVEKLVCGKFGCQSGETNCCQDCGCQTGYTCDPSGTCLFNGAKLEITDATFQAIPPAVLYAVPPKTIEKDVGSVAGFVITNRGNQKAYNVKLKYEVAGFTGTTSVDLEAINPGASIIFNLTPKFDSRAQSTNATSARMKILLEYRGISQAYNDSYAYDVPLEPGKFNWKIPEAVTAWADSSDRSVLDLVTDSTQNVGVKLDDDQDRAVRQIYGQIQARGISYSPNGQKCYSDSLAYPASVLDTKTGDCAGLSVLMSAALEAAGVRSAVIITPGAILCGYSRINGSLVLIDMRMIGQDNLTSATEAGLEEYEKNKANSTIVFPSDQWGVGVIRINPGLEVLGSRITTTSANCHIVNDKFVVNYRFKNSGYDTGRRCLNATLYDQGKLNFTRRTCVDIPQNEERNVTFTEEGINTNRTLTESCFID